MTIEKAIKIFINRGYINVKDGIIYNGNKWRQSVEVITEWFKEQLCEDAINTEKIGHWFVDERPESNREIICSNCEQSVFKYHKLDFDWRPKYCPNCGAKMVEP